ncbi:MAG: hypothetical protein Q8P30_01665, partial [Candidatus Uhrbacteria bacterium]|nr:hypothetical protein [Candidatus Uhrbacteria bacterium]
MKYVTALKGTSFALVVFSLIIVLVPSLNERFSFKGVELMLTVSTFLFAIISGFYISRLANRYDSVRTFVAEEDALFLAVFKISQHVSKGFSKKISDFIDIYYIRSYDFTLSEPAYKFSAAPFLDIWDATIQAKKLNQVAYDAMLDRLTGIEVKRNSAAAVASERLSGGEWLALISLAMIIVTSIIFLKGNDVFSIVSSILLMTVISLVLLLIRDLQNFMLGGSSLLEESGQEVFEFIGKPRYYQNRFVKNGMATIPD